ITATKRLADYQKVIGDERYEELRTLAKAAKGRTMLHINATAYGGGVAEILQNLVPLLRDAGVDAHWAVLDAPAAFYDITKKIHNALQGMKLDLSDTEKKLFLDVARENAEQLTDADVVLAHDPQAVALRHFAKDPDRAGSADPFAGLALRSLEGPARGHRRVPTREEGAARGPARHDRFARRRRPRGSGVLRPHEETRGR